jgi:hypothetical protein
MAEDDSSQENNPSPKPPRPRYPKRARQGQNWLRTLWTLPKEVLNACGRRLLNGESALDIAKWLFEQPNRGGCAHLSINTLRVYLSSLRAEMRKHDPDGRKRFKRRLHDTAKQIHHEQVRNDNVVAIDEAVASATDPAKAPVSPSVGERPGGGFEQKMELIEEQVRLQLLNPLVIEESLLHDVAVNRERLHIGFKMELTVGLVMKEITLIIHANRKHLELLHKVRGDRKKADAEWERPAGVEKDEEVDAETSAAAVDAGEMKRFEEIAGGLTPSEYDAAIRLAPWINELLDLVREEAREPKEEGNNGTHDNEKT